MKLSFVSDLPESLRLAAYVSGEEAAWPKDHALRVIDHLSQNGKAVCGVEVWLPTVPRPTIPSSFIYTWQVKAPKQGELWSDFVQRANRETKDYISSFQWDDTDAGHQEFIAYFNFEVFSEAENRAWQAVTLEC